MALSVSTERVKEKSGIADTDYDTAIDNLIAEFVPVMEASLDPVWLADSGVADTLNLGATEIVCGEFLLQMAREPGASEGFSFNGFEVFSRKVVQEAESLKAQGSTRLAPYLARTSTVVVLTGKDEAE
jgi:hypothetical protein